MLATITSFRRGRRTQTMNQMILLPKDAKDKASAEALVGKNVSFKTPSGKIIKGTVTAPHGTKGAVRAKFETGMPGQAVAQIITIE